MCCNDFGHVLCKLRIHTKQLLAFFYMWYLMEKTKPIFISNFNLLGSKKMSIFIIKNTNNLGSASMPPHFDSYINLRKQMPPFPAKKSFIKYSNLARTNIRSPASSQKIIFQRLCIREIRYSELNLEIFRYFLS
uniref:Uncharacterized protein n=1 Tax=Onchocerca volvulus TaxID=6282 RepID=A0A8R1TPE6_ONCVO